MNKPSGSRDEAMVERSPRTNVAWARFWPVHVPHLIWVELNSNSTRIESFHENQPDVASSLNVEICMYLVPQTKYNIYIIHMGVALAELRLTEIKIHTFVMYPEDIAFCSCARHLAPTMPLSTQVYKT